MSEQSSEQKCIRSEKKVIKFSYTNRCSYSHPLPKSQCQYEYLTFILHLYQNSFVFVCIFIGQWVCLSPEIMNATTASITSICTCISLPCVHKKNEKKSIKSNNNKIESKQITNSQLFRDIVYVDVGMREFVVFLAFYSNVLKLWNVCRTLNACYFLNDYSTNSIKLSFSMHNSIYWALNLEPTSIFTKKSDNNVNIKFESAIGSNLDWPIGFNPSSNDRIVKLYSYASCQNPMTAL